MTLNADLEDPVDPSVIDEYLGLGYTFIPAYRDRTALLPLPAWTRLVRRELFTDSGFYSWKKMNRNKLVDQDTWKKKRTNEEQQEKQVRLS